MSTNVVVSIEEKAVADDLPYFPEKFPGKVCCLCNLGEKSALGQGEILQLKAPAPAEMKDKYPTDRLREDGCRQFYGQKQVSLAAGECHYELDKIGQPEVVHPAEFLDEGFVYVHRMCIMWSLRKSQLTDADALYFASHFAEFLEQKCNFCGRYGASINCKMNCRQVHHWPCAAAAGCLLILESFTVFCTEHLSQVPVICSDNNVECLTCSSLGDLSKLIMCSTCGDHFHSTCIGLANLPDTRSGWNCARCTKCQICRQQDSNDTKYVKCEQCQKIYHASCLRPVISAIPKYGWKCNRCRVCTDCGSRTPGGGSSSRWHSHYTICDSCYQQRNKGFSCPICQKAYRAASHKEMVKCSWCHKFVHSTCDEEADLTAYHKKKEQNPDYDYVCPNCKSNSSGPGQSQQAIDSIVLSSMDSSSEQLSLKEIELDPLEGKPTIDPSSDELQKLPTGKKKVCLSNVRGKSGKFVLHRMGVMSQINKKRSTRGKGRQLVLPSISSDRCMNRSMDNDLTSDKKMLLCSARDKFIQAQDICVMCGSLGIESDSVMITCAQCGQCYHPYCAGVKPSRGILQKGWRCLDCTVCEGCGKKNDEARLLLCDECDISYHIYCVNPPLETVPTGNWKCSFCSLCQKCGRNPTEKSEFGDSNMLECPSCTSQSSCSVCKNPYSNGEMIIQCEHCELWSHFLCDTINAQLTIDHYDSNVYKCLKCRCSTRSSLSLVDAKFGIEDTLANGPQSSKAFVHITATSGPGFDAKSGPDRSHHTLPGDMPEPAPEAIHWIDGVCLSESGLGMIKSLSTEIKRKRKMRQAIGNGKDGAADGAAEEALEKYKDGMVWDGTENAIPEGFTISTNDEGVHILRKKRQRNLQKLGIGGFSVRNRGLKKDSEETTAVDQLSSIMNMDKKKKIIRKKQKNKLIEAYPVYLQEAFFGKPLLEAGEFVMAESDSSDEIDASMKVYFTRPEGKSPANQETTVVNKSPAKTLKKVKAEIKTENKTVFIEQMPMGIQQKTPIAPVSNVFDPLHTEISTTVFANRHPLDTLASPNIPELDTANSINTVPSTEIIEKPMRESPVVLVDNYMVPNQLPQDQKYHNQLYLPGNIAVNPAQQLHFRPQPDHLKAQNANKQNVQTIMGQVVLQTEKRAEEEPKTVEPVAENLNAGTQKTAEKMRKDEDLGLMATISAVLYANTEHPNLKELFPNWNDRCKQILKRWRSLCNEKKAPFLQKAKDNRSALRQRREQNKIPMPPKPQKQEEMGRVWKQQPKLKEDQTNMFVTYNGNAYDMATYVGGQVQPTPNNSNQHHVMPNVNDNLVIKATMQRTQVHTTAASTLKMTPVDNRLELNTVYGTEPIGDKKLRNLLQKNSTEPMLMGPNPDLFLQNDVMRMGMMQNTPITQNNPMLSISGKSQPSDGRALEQEVKMTEPQEATAAAVELENVGFSDLLGGLGEGDDDDLLKSLTSEMGDDFNILEYADPELDVNVLNALDFDENEKCST